MNSFIFASNACKTCDQKPFEHGEREVLRTAVEDICCTCGAVLQSFPAISSCAHPKGSISIPAAVSSTLEKLLKRRLFILDRGIQPQRNYTSKNQIESMANTLAHRAGDQVYLELRGPGNSKAELRWNYSHKSLLAKFPWEEFDYNWDNGSSHSRQRIELKPDLEKLDVARPARIVRACDALSDLHFTGSLIDKNDRAQKTLRFEQHAEVQEQFLDTTEDLILVIKAQLSWLQVGGTFPDTDGPREYNLSAQYLGYPSTMEEAVDEAIHCAMSSANRGAVDIHHSRDRLAIVASVLNPISVHEHENYYRCHSPRTVQHESWLDVQHGFGHSDDGRKYLYQGAFKTAEGVYLVPVGFDLDLKVTLPEGARWAGERIAPACSVAVRLGENVVFEQVFGGDKNYFSYSGYRITYRCDLKQKLPVEPGQTIVTSITEDSGRQERTYKFVCLKEYEAAWDNWRNPIIDQYKRLLIARIIIVNSYGHNSNPENNTFAGGQKVAAYLGGRWMEARYVAVASVLSGFAAQELKVPVHTHEVVISERGGEMRWQVSYVKALEDALQAGLPVVAPYNQSVPVGSQGQCLGAVAVGLEERKAESILRG